MKRYQPELGELVRELRAERGFRSQQDLADAAEIDVRTVRAIEKGGTVQEGTMGAICKELGITIGGLKERALDRRRSNKPGGGESPDPGGGPGSSSEEPLAVISKQLARIDAEVKGIFGLLTVATREDGLTEFSSRRLVSSMSGLGIPPEVIFRILERLPSALSRYVPDDAPMSTGHIRSAVSKLIAELTREDVVETDVFKFRAGLSALEDGAQVERDVSLEEIKFDWASRYARRYGNPMQIMQVLEENGQSKKLDYAFIKQTLIPQAFKRLLGDDFAIEGAQLVNPSVVSEMARTTLEEIRRLGIYSLRYRTALWLTEDLAIHPPHPWIVSTESRETTIAYDFERADANLDGIRNDSDLQEFALKHRFSEVVHHLCSAILATYSGFLGHRQTSSLHILRHWLAIQNDNPLLWARCDLRLIHGDLVACQIPAQSLGSLLKKLEVILGSPDLPRAASLVEKCDALGEIARALYHRRSKMRSYELAVERGGVDAAQYLPDLASEVIFSCFGARRVHMLRDRSNNSHIGFNATPASEGSVLSGRQPLCIFLFYWGDGSDDQYDEICERAFDQLNAHRLSETCVILCAGQPSSALRERVSAIERKLPSSYILRVLSIVELKLIRQKCSSTSDFLDTVFND